MIYTDFHVHAFPPGMVPDEIHRARARSRATRLGRDDPAYVDALVERMQANVDDPHGDRIRDALEKCGLRRAVLLGLDWGLVDGATTELTLVGQLEWARRCAAR